MCSSGVATDQCDALAKATASLPLSMGGRGCEHDCGRFGSGSGHSHSECIGAIGFRGSWCAIGKRCPMVHDPLRENLTSVNQVSPGAVGNMRRLRG